MAKIAKNLANKLANTRNNLISENFDKKLRLENGANHAKTVKPEHITWNFFEGFHISGNQKKGNSCIRTPEKKETLVLSSYSNYFRMPLTWS